MPPPPSVIPSAEGGNGEPYLGPHLSGVAIPVTPDQSLTLDELTRAIESCAIETYTSLRMQLFGAAQVRVPALDRSQIFIGGPNPGDREIIAYRGQWRVETDFPEAPATFDSQITKLVGGVGPRYADKELMPFQFGLFRFDNGARTEVRSFRLSAGLPALAFVLDGLWVDELTVLRPSRDGIDVPFDDSDLRANTIRHAECLLHETMRYNHE